MKIAVAIDNDRRPARHFGEAPGYVVYQVENGQILACEDRPKPVCDHSAGGHGHEESAEDGPDLHTRMSDVIADCQVVIAAGIPAPMRSHLANCGLQPLVLSAPSPEDAVRAYLVTR